MQFYSNQLRCVNIQNIKEKVLLQNAKTKQETTEIFLKYVGISDKTIQ